jgi:hypothetical protein
MTDPLAGIVGKLDRGFEHLERVEREVRTFLDQKPWHIAHKRDREPGWKIATFAIDREAPLEWSILAGEAIAQYHSSLDHLMTELARLRHDAFIKRPDRSPNFPICSIPGQFWSPDAKTGKVPADAVRRAVRPEHFAELERLQPRKKEDINPRSGGLPVALALYIIRTANNLNKHAVVRPAFIAPRRISYRDVHANVSGFDPLYRPMEPLHDGTKLYRAKFVGEPEMGMPFEVEPDVDFATTPLKWLPVGTIRRCGEAVVSIVGRFRDITPEFNRRPHETPPDS